MGELVLYSETESSRLLEQREEKQHEIISEKEYS